MLSNFILIIYIQNIISNDSKFNNVYIILNSIEKFDNFQVTALFERSNCLPKALITN